MGVTVTFIRHAETMANAAHIWQGQGDADLTGAGRRQATSLGGPLARLRPDLIVSSDMGRTLETARLAGLDAEADPVWREMDIGVWEGLTRAQVMERFPEELAALRRGEPIRMGGGETWMEFGTRIDAALDALVHRLDDGSRAVVVAHGGVIHSVLSGTLGFRSGGRPWPIDRVRNAALTVVAADHRGRRLITFNDARHARTDPHPDETGPVVTLVRHGESEANLTGAWHGRTDGSLSALGRTQGTDLAGWLDGIRHVYSSPLRRAAETARAYAAAKGLEVGVLTDLVEIDFGAWEDRTPAEARDADPELWRRIYEAGEDLPRGHTGERSSDAADRIERAVEKTIAAHEDGGVALFGHGGALRAYLGRVVGLGHADRRLLALPGNAAASQVRVRDEGPSLAAFNVGAV